MSLTGMYAWQYNIGWSGDLYTWSTHFEFPALNLLAEATLGDYHEYSDKAAAELGFTHVAYLNAQGQTVHENYPFSDPWGSTNLVWKNKVTRLDFWIRVRHASTSAIINAFVW